MSLAIASITAQNNFTAAVESVGKDRGEHDVGVHISGTFVATITIQRSLDEGTTWGDLATTYTAAAEVNVIPTRGAHYRAGVKTGDFTSGTVVLKVRA